MSEEQLKAFLEKVKGDSTLQEKLKAAADASNWAELTNAVVAIAKEAGFSISTDDINQTQSELSEDELEGVAGGQHTQAGAGSFCPTANNLLRIC